MTKNDLLETFPTVSPSVIKKIDDEYEIVGKYCRIIMFDDWQIDLWLCNPANMVKGLSKRKLNSLVSALEVPVESTFSDKVTKPISFSVLEGEAWINLDLPDLILNNLKLLGIREKRELTAIQKQLLVERLQGSSRDVSSFRDEHGQT